MNFGAGGLFLPTTFFGPVGFTVMHCAAKILMASAFAVDRECGLR